MSSKPIIVEEIIHAPIEKVWHAITAKEGMKHWGFIVDDFEPRPGFEFSFTGVNPQGQPKTHLCKITKVTPNKMLQYTWEYKGFDGSSLVTFELFSEGNNKTLVKLTHEGLENFPQDHPNFVKENFVRGWNEIIKNKLPEYAESMGQAVGQA